VELEKANHPRSSRLIALTPGPSADAYVNFGAKGFISGLIVLKNSQTRNAAPSKQTPKIVTNILKNNAYFLPLN
jgi:hypothetical protein